jgi:hypothetical protein
MKTSPKSAEILPEKNEKGENASEKYGSKQGRRL